jgi:trimeric autotransporter adhesin
VNLVTSGASGSFASKNVGTGKTVTISGLSLSGASASNYTLTQPTATANITPRPILGSFTADNKVYDGNTSATVLTRSVLGKFPTDNVDLTGGTATFDNKNVGTGKTVTLSGASLSGSDAGNYNLVNVAPAAANITTKGITGSFTADDKVYDGNTDATATNRTLNGTVSGDTVSLSGGTATFDDKNVGTDKDVTLNGATLSGSDASNYTLTSVATAKADITAKALTGSFTADDKVYDGNADATVASKSLPGVIGTDDVTLDVTGAQFDNKNVGTDKDVTASLALSGADAGNYVLSSTTATAKADITAKSITGSFTAADKIYDGNTVAQITGRTLNGAINGDLVSLTGGSATFNDKNVGTDKPVNGTGFTLAGVDAGNYTLSSVGNAQADIMAKSVTGNFTAADKVYDGNTNAAVTGRSLDGTIDGDDVSLTGGSASFDDKNVGTDKDVTLSGAMLAGPDASNYNLTSVATAKADITPKPITGSFTVADKEYDGNAVAQITGRSLQGAINSDLVSLSGGTASFDNKNVGSDKPVNGTGFSLSGSDAGNYTLTSVADTTADITAKSITGSFTAADKVYDGNPNATITGFALGGGVVSGDQVNLDGSSATAQFDNKSVGQNKPVTSNGFVLSGADKDNYKLSMNPAAASITAKPITGSFTAADKEYDGNASATITSRSLNGTISGDLVNLTGGTASFNDKNVGNDKPVNGTGFSLAGADASNYTLSSVANTTADITARPITVTADSKTKILAASDPQLTYQVTSGSLVTGESFSGALTRVAGETIGSYVIQQGTLTAGSNYTLTFVPGTLKIIYNFTVASGAGFLQPINYTAHQMLDTNVSTFKAGSTVPVKFVLKDANGNVVQAASPPQWLTPTKGSATSQPVDEALYGDPATTGTAYLWNGSHYQYNWSSPKNGSGFYWRIGVRLDDGQIYYVNISLR